MKKSTNRLTVRRLVLSKETLRSLDDRTVKPAVGGNSNPDTACIRCRLDTSGDTCYECPVW